MIPKFRSHKFQGLKSNPRNHEKKKRLENSNNHKPILSIHGSSAQKDTGNHGTIQCTTVILSTIAIIIVKDPIKTFGWRVGQGPKHWIYNSATCPTFWYIALQYNYGSHGSDSTCHNYREYWIALICPLTVHVYMYIIELTTISTMNEFITSNMNKYWDKICNRSSLTSWLTTNQTRPHLPTM